MIQSVTFEKTTFAELPNKFEAGTPHIAGAIGLEAAIDYVNDLGMERIAAYEADLLHYAHQTLAQIEGLRIVGTAAKKVGVISFVMRDAHAHDIGTILDTEGVAVRSGHHCAQPLMRRYGLAATVRASLAFYNTREEVDALGAALHQVSEVFN
jgi:cysteine desulfurase/selenocysteine lyase